MKKYFTRKIESLNAVFDFVHEFLSAEGINGDVRMAFDLSLEEMFVNMVKYHDYTNNDVLIELLLDNGTIKAVLTDTDVNEYDINAHKPYDTKQSLDKRKPGGIGIYLVKKVMDDVVYEYENRVSRITLIKHVRKTHV